MKDIYRLVYAILLPVALSGCLASTSSPVGVNCGPSAEKPIWERPLDCQGR